MLAGIIASKTATLTDASVIIPFVAPVVIYSNQPAYAQDAINLQRRASSQGIQRWEITANLMPGNGSADALVHGVQKGAVTSFYIRMPQVVNLEIGTNGVISNVAITAISGSTTVSTSGRLTAGEFITIGEDSKVYLVTDVLSNNSAILSPKLRVAANNSPAVRGGNVAMLCRYDTDTQFGITYTDGVLSDPGSVKFIETLR